jgi:hypothetical protein
MGSRKLLGKSRLKNPYDKRGVYETNELGQSLLENKSLVHQGHRQRIHDTQIDVSNNDPYHNHVVCHMPGAAYPSHVLKDHSGNFFDDYIHANNNNTDIGILESGPGEFHATHCWDQHYTVTDHSTLRFGSGNFTIEFWMKTGRAINIETYIMGKGSNAGRTSGGTGWVIYLTAANLLGFYDGLSNTSIQSTVAIDHDTWYHVAFVRSSGAMTIFINGVTAATGSSSGNFADTNNLIIGKDRNTSGTTYFSGLIFDIRLTASAVYADNFTAPTTLLDMTNAVFSISGNEPWHPITTTLQRQGRTVTPGNNQWIRRIPDHPFFVKHPRPTGSGRSCSVRVYERGIQISDTHPTASLKFGTNPFTVECWVYTVPQANIGIAGKGTGDVAGAGATGWNFFIDGYTTLRWSDGASASVAATIALSGSSWNHVAAVREGTGTNQFKMFVNGQLAYTGTLSANYTQTNPLVIFSTRNHQYQPSGARYFGLRISNSARYTSSFTINTSTFFDTVATNDVNTLLYMVDTKNQPAKPFKPQYVNDGYEQISVRAKFTGSHRIGSHALFTGSGYSAVNISGSANSALFVQTSNSSFAFANNDFSIEFWYCNQFEWDNPGNASPRIFFDCRGAFNDNGMALRMNFRSLQLISSGRVILSDTTTFFAQRAWTHVCIQRVNGNMAMYINGEKRSETLYAGTINATNNKMYFMNGAFGVRNDNRLYGYMSDIRVVKGTGVYAVGSTNPDYIKVPTEPLTATLETVLLTANGPTFKDYSSSANAVWAGNRTDTNYTGSWDVFIAGFGPYDNRPQATPMAVDFWDSSYSGPHAEPDNNSGDWQMTEGTWVMRMFKPWTIECWFYQPQTNPSAIATVPTWYYCSETTNGDGWQIQSNYSSTANSYNDITFTWRLARLTSGANETIATTSGNGKIAPHSWNHVAVVFDPTKTNKIAMFVNGNRVATRAAFTQSYKESTYRRIQSAGYHGTGDLRISDVARYDTDQTIYTVPNTAFQRDSNTAFLLKYEDMFKDSAYRCLKVMDGAIHPSYQYTKWGNGSMCFMNIGTAANTNYNKIYMRSGDGPWREDLLDIRYGDFTVEGWVQWRDAATGGRAFPTTAPGACWYHHVNYIWAGIDASGNWCLLNRSGTTTNTTGLIVNAIGVATSSSGNWQHVALVRKDGDFTLFVNGVVASYLYSGNHGTYASNGPTTNRNDDFYDVGNFRLGSEHSETSLTMWCGQVEDFRITALARYHTGVVDGQAMMCHIGTNVSGVPTGPFPTR